MIDQMHRFEEAVQNPRIAIPDTSPQNALNYPWQGPRQNQYCDKNRSTEEFSLEQDGHIYAKNCGERHAKEDVEKCVVETRNDTRIMNEMTKILKARECRGWIQRLNPKEGLDYRKARWN